MEQSIKIQKATVQDLPAIQKLQDENFENAVSENDKVFEGYVSFKTTVDILEDIRSSIGIICATNEEHDVVGYEFPIKIESARKIDFFDSYIEKVDILSYNGESLNESNSTMEAQICVRKDLKGIGIAELLHTAFKSIVSNKYKYIITGVSSTNSRSYYSHHKKLGFDVLQEYVSGKDKWYFLAQNSK